MKLPKTIRLLLTFYKTFFFFSFLMTLICMGLFWEYGMSIFSTLFWLKLSSLGLTIVFIRSYKSKEFYYYQNLGLSRTFLWVSTLGFDFTLYLLLLTGIYHLSAPHDVPNTSKAGTSYVEASLAGSQLSCLRTAPTLSDPISGCLSLVRRSDPPAVRNRPTTASITNDISTSSSTYIHDPYTASRWHYPGI